MFNKEKFIRCDCGAHALHLSWGEDAGYTYVELACWSMGVGKPRSWRHRLRHIWCIIRQGTPFRDFVTLNEDSATALALAVTGAAADIKAAKETT